jgi:ADP-heptose:LPS heptosyltransferase
MSQTAPETKHLIVLRFSSMGDVAMTVPVLILLLKQNPELKITVLSKPEFKDFFSDIPGCHFFSVDISNRHKGIPGLWRLRSEILKLKPYAIADLHDVIRTKILTFFLKISNFSKISTIDKGRRQKRALCAKKKNKKLNPLKSTHERYADVFRKLGFKVNLDQGESYLRIVQNQKTTAFFQSISHRNLIGLAPFARYKGKTYPIDLTENLVKILLLGNEENFILLFGSKKDFSSLDRLRNIDSARIKIIVEDFDLSEQLSVIAGLILMISMDSANMHIASMLGVRVLSIWGFTHPCLGFYGWNQRIEDAFLPDYTKYPSLPSSVNGSHGYKAIEDCMRSVDPQEIANRVFFILSKKT